MDEGEEDEDDDVKTDDDDDVDVVVEDEDEDDVEVEDVEEDEEELPLLPGGIIDDATEGAAGALFSGVPLSCRFFLSTRRMFSGLTSRCTMSWAWQYRRADTSWAIISLESDSENFPCAMMTSKDE